jgi:DNA repair protein RadC
MKKITQCTLDGIPESTPEKPKSYKVQRYRAQYVKERDDLERTLICDKTDAAAFAIKYLSDVPIEKVLIIALDTSNRITGFTCHEGMTNQCVVYPQAVFGFLLNACATSFIIAHNHPGDSSRASEADWTLTRKLKTAAAALDMAFLDHLIVCGQEVVSMRESSRWNS